MYHDSFIGVVVATNYLYYLALLVYITIVRDYNIVFSFDFLYIYIATIAVRYSLLILIMYLLLYYYVYLEPSLIDLIITLP